MASEPGISCIQINDSIEGAKNHVSEGGRLIYCMRWSMKLFQAGDLFHWGWKGVKPDIFNSNHLSKH